MNIKLDINVIRTRDGAYYIALEGKGRNYPLEGKDSVREVASMLKNLGISEQEAIELFKEAQLSASRVLSNDIDTVIRAYEE